MSAYIAGRMWVSSIYLSTWLVGDILCCCCNLQVCLPNNGFECLLVLQGIRLIDRSI